MPHPPHAVRGENRTHLGPNENGLNVFCTRFLSLSNQRSGRNASTSSPQTSLSRWIVYVGTLSTVPSGKNCPHTVRPPSGTSRGRPMPDVEWMRSASLMTASR